MRSLASRSVDLFDTYVRTPIRDTAGDGPSLPNEQLTLLLPMFLVDRKNDLEPVDETRRFDKGRTVLWLVTTERGDEARAWLTAQGWIAVPPGAAAAVAESKQIRR